MVQVDDKTRSGGFRFRLVDVVVVVTVLSVLFGIAAIVIRGARSQHHQQTCSHNAMLIVVDMHNYADVNRKLPALTLGPGRPSFYLAGNRYHQDLTSPMVELEAKSIGVHLEQLWDKLSATEKELESRVAYQCPARSRQRLKLSGAGRGPATDYATPVLVVAGDWTQYYDPCGSVAAEQFLSLLRPADVDCANRPVSYVNSRPRDGFQRLVDGTSNVLAIGEKHLRPGELTRCCGPTWRTGADGSSLFADDQHRMYSIARNALLPIAQNPRDWSDGGPDDDFSFGSWHAEVFTVAMMDGSVRALSVEVDPYIIESLANVQDGLDTGLD